MRHIAGVLTKIALKVIGLSRSISQQAHYLKGLRQVRNK